MKKLLVALCCSLIVHAAYGSPRSGSSAVIDETLLNSEPPTVKPENVVYVPVPMQTTQKPKSSDQQRDTELFNTFFSIAAHFGKILIDPHNTPSVLQSAGSMISGIVEAVQTITKTQQLTNLPPEMVKTLLMERIVKEAQRRNNALKQTMKA